MSCNVPHDLLDVLMPCIMICMSDIIAEQGYVPNIERQHERMYLPRQLTGMGCFPAARQSNHQMECCHVHLYKYRHYGDCSLPPSSPPPSPTPTSNQDTRLSSAGVAWATQQNS